MMDSKDLVVSDSLRGRLRAVLQHIENFEIAADRATRQDVDNPAGSTGQAAPSEPSDVEKAVRPPSQPYVLFHWRSEEVLERCIQQFHTDKVRKIFSD
jgi:hypothetical protein